jgi:lipopolysaccharide/colanic/teichoic acid biosynthesis glycosyltransferase
MHERFGKRALDIVAASLLLVALAPLLAAVAIAVRWRLGAPVLFTQPRAGLHGAPFDLRKFRSMAAGPGSDAERLDGFGRRLRAYGLDELPQLLNVLRGEMSLVGPRPLPLDYLPLYSPRQALRLRVRPGLLGPGVAAGRNAVPWDRRLELDAAYAEAPARLRTDLALALRSLAVWLSGQGTTAPGHATMPPLSREAGRRTDGSGCNPRRDDRQGLPKR